MIWVIPGSILLFLLLSIPRATRGWARFMLHWWLAPNGLLWGLSLAGFPYSEEVTAALAMLIVSWAGLAMLLSRPSPTHPPVLSWGRGLPLVVLWFLGLGVYEEDFRAYVPPVPQPLATTLVRPQGRLTVAGVALGDLRTSVEQRLGPGRERPLRPLLGLFTAREYPGVVVYYRRSRVAWVEGPSLEQEGKVLLRAGDSRDHAELIRGALGVSVILEGGRVVGCRMHDPILPKNLLAQPLQVYSVHGVELEMSRAEVERKLGPGKALDLSKLGGERRSRLPAGVTARRYGRPPLWVVYDEGYVRGVAGPTLEARGQPVAQAGEDFGLASQRLARLGLRPPLGHYELWTGRGERYSAVPIRFVRLSYALADQEDLRPLLLHLVRQEHPEYPSEVDYYE